MGNRNNIQSLQGGRMKRFPLPTFCSYVRKKKREKTIKTKFVFEGQSNGGFNLQHTTTMHKWGQVQKREKSFYWHTSWQLQKPNCMSSLPPFTPPLTQVVFDYPPLEFDLTPLPPIPTNVGTFPSKCPFLPEYFLIENT